MAIGIKHSEDQIKDPPTSILQFFSFAINIKSEQPRRISHSTKLFHKRWTLLYVARETFWKDVIW
ncbi:hypothetical protein VB005_11750 [Metarhizium brunneum]